MSLNKRVDDVNQVFDRQWNVNHNYQQVKAFHDNRKSYFNKMYNIMDKDARKKEILEANSVEGRVDRLQQNMNAASGNELFRNRIGR